MWGKGIGGKKWIINGQLISNPSRQHFKLSRRGDLTVWKLSPRERNFRGTASSVITIDMLPLVTLEL